MQEAKKSTGELFKSGEKTTVMLDFVHETFDQRPFVITIGIVLTRFLTVFARRNNGNGPMLKNKLNEGITVIAPIGQHILTGVFTQQIFSLGDVMPFTARQDEVQRVAQRIDFDVNFGAEPATTTPQRLGFLPTVFLTPLPRRDARARRYCPASHFPCPDQPRTRSSCVPRSLCHTSAQSAYTRYSMARIHWVTSAIARHFLASTARLPQIDGSALLARHRCQDTPGEIPGFSSIGHHVIELVS